MSKGGEVSHQDAAWDALASVLEVIKRPDVLGGAGRDLEGGYLRMYRGVNPHNGPSGWRKEFELLVGVVDSTTQSEKCEMFSFEQAVRLMAHHATEHHYASWQSRNPALWRYGGGVIVRADLSEDVRGLILVSFSGLPEEADETMSLVFLHHLGYIDEKYHRHHITQVTGNTVTPLCLGH